MTTCINEPTPTCPRCLHAMTIEEMLNLSELDLFALAPDEGSEQITCPSCDQKYWVQGSYKPQYSSAISEDDL